jgi:peptidoglycan/xylan/chitin deacetylase (PgdA/CDA1 family)
MPKLQQYGYNGTFYIISGVLNSGNYMSSSQVLQLRNAGNEIASHTVTHPDMVQLTPAQQDVELQQSKADLEALIGAPVANFCTPYGSYNDALLAKIKQVYSSHRTVQSGFNTKADTDFYQLKVQNIYNTTTKADVAGWVATAKAQGSWLILVYHEIMSSPGQYDTTPALFDAQLQAIQASGLTVKTLAGAMAEVAPQL